MDLIEALLAAGTWTNYGTTPQILKEGHKSKRHSLKQGIYLFDDNEDEAITATNNTVIFWRRNCSIEIYTKNSDDADKMLADIETIFKNTRARILNIKPADLESRYKFLIDIEYIE